MNIHYRMTVYDGTLFSDTTTVLTPAANAPHTDPFRVTTMPNLAGYKPYMRLPRGERGAFDFRKASSTVGRYSIELLDKRTGTGNINRWVTAFIGDGNSLLKLVGRKVVIEETVDGGTSWQSFFVGRINNVNLNSPVSLTFEIGDTLELMKQRIFTSRPAVDYVVFKSMLPLGVIKDLANDGNETSKIAAVQGLRIQTVSAGTDSRIITLTNEELNNKTNFWPFEPQEDYSSNPNTPLRGTLGSYADSARLRVMIQVGNNFYHYILGYMERVKNFKNASQGYTPIEKFRVLELPDSDPDYAPLTAIDGNLMAVKRIWVYRLTNDDGSKLNAFWLTKNPYTILSDICEGRFFTNPDMQLNYDSGSLAALSSTYPLPNTVFRISEPMEAVSFIEEHICLPYSIGYTIEPVGNTSQLRFFSTRQPSSYTGLETINGSDVIANSAKEWMTNEPVGSVRFTYYLERGTLLTNSTKNLQITPDIENVVELQFQDAILPAASETVDSSYKTETINFTGIRGVDKNPLNSGNAGKIGETSAYAYANSEARKLATEYFNRRKSGIPTVRLSTVRNTKTNALRVGDFVLVEVEVLPNQATHTRGGTRVMQILQKTPDGLQNDFELIDSGINATMNTPSLGTITSPADNEISFTVTTTEKAAVEIAYAVANLGGSAPAANSDMWRLTERLTINNTTSTQIISGLPEGKRIFVRVRATSPDAGVLRLPSPWVTSSGFDLTNLSAPTNVTVDRISSRSARVQWTNTETEYAIEIWLASPAGEPTTPIVSLPPLSTSFILRGLDKNSSASHRVGVRYSDGFLGNSAFATADFTATGDAPVLDAPAAILLYVSR